MHRRLVIAIVALAVSGTGTVLGSGPVRGFDGEAEQILERIRLYRDRHGIAGELDSEQMLERTRWGYERWLAADHHRRTKHTTTDGWVSLGPVNGAGRMTALAPHPTVDGTVLAGAASGGVWKTTDHGLSWRPLTDGLADLSVGAVVYAPSNPEIVYLGTGEGGLGSFFVPGIGLLRSSDGGETWFLPQPGEVVAEQFFALSVDPGDEDRVVAATERGLFASDDGGVTWDLRLGHPELYGVTEVIRSSADPDRLWSALWCFSHCPDGLARVMTSADGGLSWTPADAGLPDALLNNPLSNRIALAVAPSDDRVLYVALNTDRYTPQGPEVAIYRSADGGATWTITADPGVYMLGQGWYDNAITVAPTDPDTVIAAGVWYVRTTDGGASWTTMDPIAAGDWMGTDTLPHVDGHAFAWQKDELWLACDGGVWVSGDDGATWSGRNDSLVTRQYYGLDIDAIRPDRLLGGTQDNKTNLRTGPGDDDWEWVLDGDGFDCAINPLVPDLVYGTIYGTLVFRSLDGGGVWHDISPSTGGDSTPFATPLTMRRDLPWELFTGSSRVWRSGDAGSSWEALGTDVADGEWTFNVVRSVAVTPADHLRVVIAKGKEIYASTDGGRSWFSTPVATNVNDVAISPLDAELALAALARTPDHRPQLVRSTDGGLSWHDAAGGLPPFAVQVVEWHPHDDDVAFAGTDVGLYRSTDGGLSWNSVGDGLPAVSVHDLRIAEDGTRVVVASHGRGIWQLELAEAIGESPMVVLEGPELASIGDAVHYTATATDADGDGLELRFLSSDDWRIIAGGVGVGTVQATLDRTFTADGEYLVAGNALDATGRMGFDSKLVRVWEPGDDCSTPRVIPGAGPFPSTILTDNTAATVGPSDPEVPCASWAGDPDAGRWGSIWFEFTPEESGTYIVTTCGSKPDTALSLWTGPACGPYEPVVGGCNDDDRLRNCSGRETDSWLELDLEEESTVRVLVGTTEDIETGALRITIDCTSCRPPPDEHAMLIAAAARTPGAEDSFWTSTLQLINPGDVPTTASVELLPGPGSSSATGQWALAPGEAVVIDDIVGDLLGETGSGALRLRSPLPIAAVSRTATAAGGGSFGQGIPAIADTSVATNGEAVRLIGFASERSFRTNLGLVNPGPGEVSVLARFYDGETNKLAESEHELAPESWLQLNRVLAAHDIAADAELIVVRQISKTGRFTGYASVVDESTGDPTYLHETGVGRVGDPLWIPASAHVTGVGGAQWRTDLVLFNPGTGDLITKIELIGNDGVAAETTIHVPDGWTRSLADVVAEVFETEGAGAIRLSPSLGLVMATSRTFAATTSGSYGQGIPGMAESGFASSGERIVLPGLRQDQRFRTNVGFVNAGEDPIDLVITAHRTDGAVLDEVTVRVEGSSWLQLNQPLPPGTGYVVVSSPNPGARYHAYASVVDRATDDPTYIAAVPADDEVLGLRY